MYFKRPGTGGALSNGWYKIIGGYYKVGGVWKTIFNRDINFKLYSEGFGNPNGGPTSGSTGTGGIPTAVNIPASAPKLWNSDRGNDNAGTVPMADGTDKNIEDVVVGDVVKGHNGDNTVNFRRYTFNDRNNSV